MMPFNKGNQLLSALLKKDRINSSKAAIRFYNRHFLPFVGLTVLFAWVLYSRTAYHSPANLLLLTTISALGFALFLLLKLYRSEYRQKAAVSRSRVSELRFNKIYESGMIPLLIANMDGSVKQANDAFLALIGYTQEDLRAGQINWRIRFDRHIQLFTIQKTYSPTQLSKGNSLASFVIICGCLLR